MVLNFEVKLQHRVTDNVIVWIKDRQCGPGGGVMDTGLTPPRQKKVMPKYPPPQKKKAPTSRNGLIFLSTTLHFYFDKTKKKNV